MGVHVDIRDSRDRGLLSDQFFDDLNVDSLRGRDQVSQCVIDGGLAFLGGQLQNLDVTPDRLIKVS